MEPAEMTFHPVDCTSGSDGPESVTRRRGARGENRGRRIGVESGRPALRVTIRVRGIRSPSPIDIRKTGTTRPNNVGATRIRIYPHAGAENVNRLIRWPAVYEAMGDPIFFRICRIRRQVPEGRAKPAHRFIGGSIGGHPSASPVRDGRSAATNARLRAPYLISFALAGLGLPGDESRVILSFVPTD